MDEKHGAPATVATPRSLLTTLPRGKVNRCLTMAYAKNQHKRARYSSLDLPTWEANIKPI